MSHELEINPETGNASFASLREPAWHSLGTVFDEPVSTSEMLHLASLDNWDVRIEPVTIPSHYRMTKPVNLIVRNSPFTDHVDVLGSAGDRYRVLQNEELFEFGSAIASIADSRWETAGSIKGGRQVFGSIQLNSTDIGPDRIDNYILLHTSHDGSAAITASNTSVRVVCANTLNFALAGVQQQFKVRHTATLSGRIQDARESLSVNAAYSDTWSEEMNRLLDWSIDDNSFERIIQSIYVPPALTASKSAFTRFDSRMDSLWSIYNGDTVGAVRGTKWGALNALTEQLDYDKIGRGNNADENLAVSAAGLDAIANGKRQTILSKVVAFA